MTPWPAWDLQLFHVMNGRWHTPILDQVMPVFTNSEFLTKLVVMGLVALAVRAGSQGRRAVLAALVAIALSDVVASQILKPAIHRQRPCRTESDIRLLVRCGGRNGFPSNHAANAGALAGALAVCFPGSVVLTVPIALGVAWSRVYVGVHYPLDVAAGLLFGGGVGWSVAMAFPGARRRRKRPPDGEWEGGPIAESGKLR